MRNPSYVLPVAGSTGTKSLEATYEESKRAGGGVEGEEVVPLEATYEESKPRREELSEVLNRLHSGSYL